MAVVLSHSSLVMALCVSGCLTLLTTTDPVAAETAEASAPSPEGLALPEAEAGDDTVRDNREIIVTAQRRNERLENVPMTVSVVTQETLENAGISSIRDIANVTSGFQIANAGNTPQPAVRGVTTTNAGAYENNVALFVDGLYQPTSQVLNMDLPNVENIQILKGPQGTLYGRNATGGAILIDTITPGDVWKGSIEATYARFNDRRARGYVSGPMSDKVGISLAGTIRRTDGYYKIASRTTPGQFDGRGLGLRQESLRAKLKFDLTETFRATLGYNYLRANDPRGVLFTPVENVANSYTVPGRNTRPRGLGEAAGDVFINEIRLHEGSLKLELDTGIGKLRSITGYTVSKNRAAYDSNGSYVPDLWLDAETRDRTWQESLDFNIEAIDNLNLILGGTYYNIETDFTPGQENTVYLGPASLPPFAYPDPAVTTVPLTDYKRAASFAFFRVKKAWALFIDATFQATDRLSINVGGRYSDETQDGSGQSIFYSTTTGAITGCAYSRFGETIAGFTCINGASARKSHYSKFTPRASIRYELSPGTNIYASYSLGFRGGERNSAIPNNNPAQWTDAKQETIDSYEVGFKTAGSRLRFDLAGFYIDYKNMQIATVTFVDGLAVVTLQNAPRAKIYGAEANFDYKVTGDLTVRGGATWLHGRYGDNFVYVGNGVNPAAPGFNVNSDPLKTFVNVSGLVQNLSGAQMARAPDFTGFIGFEYNIPHGDGGLKFAANLKYTTGYPVTDVAVWGGETLASYLARKAVNPNVLPNNAASPSGVLGTSAIGLIGGTPYESRASEQRARQGAFVTLSASVTWTDPSDHYYVRVWGTNLTDVTYRVHYRPSSGTYIPIGEPMSFGGTIGYKFR